jgi:hypothetical protein
MKQAVALLWVLVAGCSEKPGESEPEAERSTSEGREAYRKRIDELAQAGLAKRSGMEGYTATCWMIDGKKVRETAGPGQIGATLDLPPREAIVRIEYRNHGEPYFVVQTPEEINLFYDCILRQSSRRVPPSTARYFYPDGSGFDVPIGSLEIFSHGCAMGLFFYGEEKLIYELSGHPGSPSLEPRLTREEDVTNPVLNGLLKEYCRRSPSYRAEHPDE